MSSYIGPEFTKVLEKTEVEYRQVNLTVPGVSEWLFILFKEILNLCIPAAVASAYDVAEGQPPFDYVFDFTGEVRHDRSEAVSRKYAK